MPHLNRYLARHVYLSKRRDKDGRIVLRGPPRERTPTPKEEFAAKWIAYGMAPHRIDQLWRRYFD